MLLLCRTLCRISSNIKSGVKIGIFVLFFDLMGICMHFIIKDYVVMAV